MEVNDENMSNTREWPDIRGVVRAMT